MQKFKIAQAQNKLSIERHLEAIALLNSSSEDEDEANEEDAQHIVDKVISAYQGQRADAEKVISYLINSLQSSSVVCLICISTVKKTDPVIFIFLLFLIAYKLAFKLVAFKII